MVALVLDRVSQVLELLDLHFEVLVIERIVHFLGRKRCRLLLFRHEGCQLAGLSQGQRVDERGVSDGNLANWADALAEFLVILLEAGVAFEMEAGEQSVHQLRC